MSINFGGAIINRCHYIKVFFFFQFYILENNLEIYARDMLFLTIALEPQSRMGLQGKIFFEMQCNLISRATCRLA